MSDIDLAKHILIRHPSSSVLTADPRKDKQSATREGADRAHVPQVDGAGGQGPGLEASRIQRSLHHPVSSDLRPSLEQPFLKGNPLNNLRDVYVRLSAQNSAYGAVLCLHK